MSPVTPNIRQLLLLLLLLLLMPHATTGNLRPPHSR
jgi:hypothetical protein